MQTINTLTVRLNKYIERKYMQTSYVIKTDREQLTRHLGTHMDIWRHRQTGRQTETQPFFHQSTDTAVILQ